MNDKISILPSLFVQGPEKAEILACTAIGQTARADRLRLIMYARSCGEEGLQFIARRKDLVSYVVDGPDDENFNNDSNWRNTDVCKLCDWASPLPSIVIDGIVALRDKINLTNLHIEYTTGSNVPDPALLYFLGEYRSRKYFVKLAQWGE